MPTWHHEQLVICRSGLAPLKKKEWLDRGAEQKTSRCLKSVHFCNIKQHSMIGMGLSFLAGTARYQFLFILFAKTRFHLSVSSQHPGQSLNQISTTAQAWCNHATPYIFSPDEFELSSLFSDRYSLE
jgi:hypothetical protein